MLVKSTQIITKISQPEVLFWLTYLCDCINNYASVKISDNWLHNYCHSSCDYSDSVHLYHTLINKMHNETSLYTVDIINALTDPNGSQLDNYIDQLFQQLERDITARKSINKLVNRSSN